MTFWKWNDNFIVLFELWRSMLKMDMFYCKNWPCDIVIKYSLNKHFTLFFLVVSYSQCNVLTGHHCVLEIIWSVISWYLSHHLSFKKDMGVLNLFLCVYKYNAFIYTKQWFDTNKRASVVEENVILYKER